MSLGERIKKARLDRNLSQVQLAEGLGVAVVTVRQYESNKREPTIAMICNLAEKLDINPAYLLGMSARKTRFDIENSSFEEEDFIDENGKEFRVVLSDREKSLARLRTLSNYLNKEGIDKVSDLARDLAEIPKYRRDIDNVALIHYFVKKTSTANDVEEDIGKIQVCAINDEALPNNTDPSDDTSTDEQGENDA
jgi:transcriptional regulator with XRE-family HTH domain